MVYPRVTFDKRSSRRLYIYAIVAVIIIVIAGYAYYLTIPKSPTFIAMLSKNSVVPNPTNSAATGEADFYLSSDGNTMHFVLNVNGIVNVTAAHIHLGNATQNGPVIVPLFLGPAKTGSFSGVLAEGDITASTLAGILAGHPLSDLLADIQVDNCYVNVHTKAFPAGEIRGQMVLGP